MLEFQDANQASNDCIVNCFWVTVYESIASFLDISEQFAYLTVAQVLEVGPVCGPEKNSIEAIEASSDGAVPLKKIRRDSFRYCRQRLREQSLDSSLEVCPKEQNECRALRRSMRLGDLSHQTVVVRRSFPFPLKKDEEDPILIPTFCAHERRRHPNFLTVLRSDDAWFETQRWVQARWARVTHSSNAATTAADNVAVPQRGPCRSGRKLIVPHS